MKQWYERLFSNYAKGYDNEPFTKGTMGEVDFLQAEAAEDQSWSILDIGCGTGRHSVELARRGFRVTGIDLSEAQLRGARQKAREAGVKATFLKRDARSYRFRERFDLAIMLCEGGFSLMETDEMNFEILRNAARALRPGGKLIFSALNALYPLAHNVFAPPQKEKAEEGLLKGPLNLMDLRARESLTFTDDSGKTETIECNERFFMPSEIAWYLKSLRFSSVEIFGCTLGAFSRKEPLTPDHFELLVVARTGS